MSSNRKRRTLLVIAGIVVLPHQGGPADWAFKVIFDVSSVREALLLYPQLRAYYGVAANRRDVPFPDQCLVGLIVTKTAASRQRQIRPRQ